MARSHCTTKVAVSRPPRKAQSRAKASGASGLPDVKQEPEETAITDTVPLSVHKLSGRLPPFQPPCSYAVDHENTSVFFNIYDETEEDGERSTIYCCDVLTKKWKNLTSSIRHLPQPFGSPPRKQPLPPRFGSAMAYYKSSVHGQRILLLFGGQIDGTSHNRGEVSNELIAVDVDNCTWWVVQLAGGDAEPRVESRLVVSGDQLFLFGGKTFMDGRFEAVDSFCVASFRDMQWTWDVLDAPYPENIPSLGWCCGGTLMHDGDAEHILLTMGCDNPYNEYKRVWASYFPFVLFNIGLHTFKRAEASANLEVPAKASYHNMQTLPASMKESSAASVIFCSFDVEELDQPQFNVYSQGSWRSLALSERFIAIKCSLEVFVVVDSRLYLIGYNEKSKEVYDTLVEIPKEWICT